MKRQTGRGLAAGILAAGGHGRDGDGQRAGLSLRERVGMSSQG